MFTSEKRNVEIMLHCAYLKTWHIQKPEYTNLEEVKKKTKPWNQAEESFSSALEIDSV